MKNIKYKLTVYLIFGAAMAYVESAVVVYLRLLYYPDGFRFPLKIIPEDIAIIELGREAATIIMLWFVAKIGARNFREKFSLFIFTFGVWDLFYYGWLKLMLNWPGDWLEWDVLFLIPVPWFAPWLAPAIVSMGFIFSSILILRYPDRFLPNILSRKGWFVEISSAFIIIWSFLWETGSVLGGNTPAGFPWWLFLTGMTLGLVVFMRQFMNNPRKA
ncbi:MAG: hypothetical protein AB7T22_14425 [Calditrichaceae bacterium]